MKFTQIRGTGSDETALYAISDHKATIGEFVDEVRLHRGKRVQVRVQIWQTPVRTARNDTGVAYIRGKSLGRLEQDGLHNQSNINQKTIIL